MNLRKIVRKQRRFVRERAWEKFHNPKNLAMALAGEAGELLEIFQWKLPKATLTPREKQATEHELADIFYYLIRLCDLLDVDLEEAFWKKMKINSERYPASIVKGSAKKYTELREKSQD